MWIMKPFCFSRMPGEESAVIVVVPKLEKLPEFDNWFEEVPLEDEVPSEIMFALLGGVGNLEKGTKKVKVHKNRPKER